MVAQAELGGWLHFWFPVLLSWNGVSGFSVISFLGASFSHGSLTTSKVLNLLVLAAKRHDENFSCSSTLTAFSFFSRSFPPVFSVEDQPGLVIAL